MKMRNKILLLTISLILLLGVLSVFFIETTLTNTLMSELTERAVFLTKYLGQESADDLITENRLRSQLRINNFMKNNDDIDYIYIFDAEGKAFVHTFQNGFPVELLHDNDDHIVNSRKGAKFRILKTETGKIYEFHVDILKSRVGTLHIGYSISHIENRVTEITELMVIIISSVVIFGGLIAFTISTRLIKPLSDLTEAAQIIGSGNMKYRVENVSKDEIGILSASFNEMVEDLQIITASRDELDKEITERKKSEEKLEQMAYYDQLTNLPNRTNFVKYLGRMLKRTKRESDYLFAVLFIDIDRFKVINDSLGHIIGDKLLVAVACRLETSIRPTDKISRDAGNDRVSRFGGDEFAVFLNDIKDISSASRVADRIQMELQKPLYIDGHELFTSASIGIALSTTGYENAEDILRDADSAMYRAKDTGRAHAEIFDNAMHVRVSQILKLESDLRTAVKKEQFMIYYQPIVSATDGSITGAEALIRWNHPQQGIILPMDFIPIAEETGLISTIGEWVLRTACAQNKAWYDAGYQYLLMKINFSSRQFKDKSLIEVVKKVIRETGIPAQFLDVEVTESIVMEKNSIQILNQLTAMGLQTSIDDFGTGYSSLALLTEFPINTIKIDKAFVDNLAFSSTAEAIIKAIIAMAHSLNMEVVAEGVETEEQLAFLKSQKCDKIQGYLFSPPVPEEKFRKLLEQCTIVPSPIN